jgi:hypothetical protein
MSEQRKMDTSHGELELKGNISSEYLCVRVCAAIFIIIIIANI